MSDSGTRKLVNLSLLGIGAYIAYQYYVQIMSEGTSDSVTDPMADATSADITGSLQSLYEDAMNKLTGNWASQGDGPTYVPILNQAENQYGIPPNLLARIAYQESHFRPDIISGATRSGAGAVGIMQLMPQYFPGAGSDPTADIQTAAAYLAKLYGQFGDWQVAVAAYNDGPGNVTAYLNGSKTLPLETQNYVAGVFADVPVQGSLVQV